MNLAQFRFLLLSLIFLMTFFFTEAMAQSDKLPPFRIIQPNGKVFKAEYLPFEKPIVIIYFSPDCEDCLEFMDSFFKKIYDFNEASIVMITFMPIEYLTKFSMKYGIKGRGNIYLGTEGSSYFVRDYFKMDGIPFVALYDKDGNVKSTYCKSIPLNDLIASLKKM